MLEVEVREERVVRAQRIWGAVRTLHGLPWWLSGKESTCQWRRFGEDPLEKEMATHSSILAWEIPWMEELGGLQSILTKLKAMNIGVVYLAVENSHCNH